MIVDGPAPFVAAAVWTAGEMVAAPFERPLGVDGITEEPLIWGC